MVFYTLCLRILPEVFGASRLAAILSSSAIASWIAASNSTRFFRALKKQLLLIKHFWQYAIIISTVFD